MLTRTALTVAVSAALFVVTAEIAARVALASPAYAHRLAARNEAGRKLVTLARQGDVPLGGLWGTGGFRAHPTLGWTGGPMEKDGLHTNAHGHRWVREGGAAAPAGAPRVLLLGDSFTFGDEVRDEETWAWQLASLTGYEVVNAGAVGYGVDQAWLRWREELASSDADVVVLGLNIVMSERCVRAWDNWAKPRVRLGAAAELEIVGTPLPPPEALLLPWHASRARMLVDVWQAPGPGAGLSDDTLDVIEAMLADLVADASSRGTRVVLAYLPIQSEYEPPEHDEPGLRARWSTWCGTPGLGARCVDLRPVFRAARAAGTNLSRGVHWTPAGHQLVATAVADVLDEPAR